MFPGYNQQLMAILENHRVQVHVLESKNCRPQTYFLSFEKKHNLNVFLVFSYQYAESDECEQCVEYE